MMKKEMNRRTFFRLGVTGAAAAALRPAIPVLSPGSQDSPALPEFRPFELEEATLDELQSRMASGAETSRSLCEKYISRIEDLNLRGPQLRAVLQINDDALEIADRLDAERRAGKLNGPLHGIPVLVKDNIATADKMETTAGSLALLHTRPPEDSFVARKLRAAGAVILGKTNLSEWANFRSTHSTDGWSGRGLQNKNPYALDRSPSGSSSGSGAGAAANLCAVAVGTETDGSITAPANNNSLVGIKPTLGLISRHGIIPIAHSQDTAGPMCRTVRDAAILLSALAGSDPQDTATRPADGKRHRDYTKFLDSHGLKGARLGVVRKPLFGSNPAADRLVESALAQMKKLGAEIIDPVNIGHFDEIGGPEMEVLLYEFKTDLHKYLAWLGPKSPMKSLRDLIAFNTAHAREEMPYFGQEIFEQAEAKGPLTEKKYLGARAKCLLIARKEGIDAVMDKHRLDALVAPTATPPILIDLVNGAYGGGNTTTLPAVAGYPHITVPAGFDFGLPVGISFFGRAWSEPVLLKIAYACEQATHQRQTPKFLATADLSIA